MNDGKNKYLKLAQDLLDKNGKDISVVKRINVKIYSWVDEYDMMIL